MFARLLDKLAHAGNMTTINDGLRKVRAYVTGGGASEDEARAIFGRAQEAIDRAYKFHDRLKPAQFKEIVEAENTIRALVEEIRQRTSGNSPGLQESVKPLSEEEMAVLRQELAAFKVELGVRGEGLVKETLAHMSPEGSQWLSMVAEHVEATQRDLREKVSDPAHSGSPIRELYEVAASTAKSVETGVSIDGGSVVAPPVSPHALCAILDFYLDAYPDEEAWTNFMDAVRAAQSAQRL